MNRSITRVFLFGIAALGVPLALDGGALSGLVGLMVTVTLACVADEKISALAVALGALAGLSLVLWGDASVLIATGLASGLIWGARARRARGSMGLAVTVFVAIGTGAAAGGIASGYGGHEEVGVRLAALVVAGIIASVPMVVPVDDRVTLALDDAALRAGGRVLSVLSLSVVLRRRVLESDALEALSEGSRERIEGVWRSLAAMARRRAELDAGEGVATVLDEKIEAHVAALQRVHTAAEARYERSLAVSDQGLAEAAVEGESLEAEVEALGALGALGAVGAVGAVESGSEKRERGTESREVCQ